MDALIALITIVAVVAGLMGLAIAALVWGVDSRDSIADHHNR